MNGFRALVQQLRQLWQGLTPRRRLAFSAIAAGVAGLVLFVAYWATQPDYRVLFAGLSPEDASALTAKIQAQNVPFRLEGGGSTILVPVDQVALMRVQLAADDLPGKGGKGWELFDQTPLGMTPFTQHVNYSRALQAELARTIMQIEPVVSARVHIVRPDPSPFVRDQKPTTASVVLRLKPGTTLNRRLSAGIVALVSRSVEGLTADQVALVDTSGNLLTEDRQGDTAHLSSQMDLRRTIEKDLAERAENYLAKFLGPGRALVRVTADLSAKHIKKTEVRVNPDNRAALKEKTTKNQTTNPGQGTKGPAGAASNMGKGGASASGSSTLTAQETQEFEYAVERSTNETEDKPGAIERLTIAALVDLSPRDKDAKGAPAIDLAEVQEHIMKAVGFKKTRGDEIKVSNVRLEGVTTPTETEDVVSSMNQWQSIIHVVRNASLAVVALAGLAMAWMILRRVKPPAAPAAPEKNAALDRLAAAAQQDPEAIARLLARWLDQGDKAPRQAA